MNELEQSLIERLIASNLKLAEAIQSQSQGLNALAAAVVEMACGDDPEGAPSMTYMDGTPR